MERGKVILLIAILAMACGKASRGDIIELGDGSKISGTLKGDDANVVITADDGTVLQTTRANVVRVTLTNAVSLDQTAKAEWDRTSAEINNSSDLAAILQLHQKFLAKYANQPAAADAKASLQKYQTLVADHAVKFRGKWMRPEDVSAQQQKWMSQASASTKDFDAGLFDNAIADATAALKIDPHNPLAGQILGLSAYAANNPLLSKQTFSKLAADDPGNLLALNNLAIISFDQKSPDAGLHYYLQALAVKPDNRLLLDNIASSLNSYPNKRDQTFQQLSARFTKADSAMQLTMAPQGLYRWGANWVDKKTLATRRTQMLQIVHDMNALDAQYQSDTNQYNVVQGQVVDAESNYNQATADDDPNADYYYSQWTDLSSQLMRIDASIQQERAAAVPLKARLSKAQQIQYPPARLMNPGEEVKPLPPAPVDAAGT